MNDTTENSETRVPQQAPRRRSPRRWVISGFIAVLLLALLFTRVWILLKAASDCQSVLSAAEAAGGTVRVTDTWYENPYLGYWPSEVRIRLKQYLPDDMQYLDRWQKQTFSFDETAAIDDNWLLERNFAALPCDVDVRISNPQVTDAGIQSLATVTKLESLLVPRPSLTDEGLKAFTGHPHLARLSLHETQVTAASLPALTSMPNLIVLVVSCTDVPGDELHQLRACPNLQYLAVDAEQLTEPFLSSLSTFPKLTGLSVIVPTNEPTAESPGASDNDHPNVVVDDALLQRLLRETTITYLWIEDGRAITDASVPALLKAGHLHRLDTWNVNMSVEGAHQVNSVLRSWDGKSAAIRLPGESTVYRDAFANEYK